ncbi:MAG: hypothetical protein OEY57_09120, partial [Nitrospirota bacterium]|nr:hypothetical protein [Nitrospirota bacterium]
MEKRVVLFLVLSLGIIFGYDLLLKQLGYSPFSNSPIIDEEIHQPESPEKPRTDHSASSTSDPSLKSPAISSDHSELVTDQSAVVKEEIIFVETPLVRVGLSNQGAAITSWELKN